MIVWLASYPRSGNTMFQMMLHQVFGCSTYTKYFSPQQAREWNASIPRPTGRVPLPGRWPDCMPQMAQRPQTCLVKTHDGPESESKAIYIVRNGFAVVRSYKSYLRDFNGRDYSLEQIILGETQFRSWGWHLDAWDPLQRPDTLLLKYEDLVKSPDQQLQRVADFTGFKQQAKWVNEFDKLHAANPKMYRRGPTSDPTADFTPAQQELFWAMHGDWMARLGYDRENGQPPQPARALRQAASDRLLALDPDHSAAPKRPHP